MTTPTFSRQAFEDVASFLPLFGSTSFDFGTWVVRQGSFPFVTYHPEVGRFVRTLERHGWVYESPDFLWGPWLRTPEARGLLSGETLGQATPEQLARLLTVFARQERIVDGSRLEMYQSGVLLGLLRRVQEWAHQFPWVSEADAPALAVSFAPAAPPVPLELDLRPFPASAQAHPSSSLTFSEAARRVHDFISQFEEGYFPPLLMLARLTEETGEIARVLAHQNGKKPKPGEEAGDLEMELADLLFVVICMANERGLSLERGFVRMLDKIERRDQDRWTRKELPEPPEPAPQKQEPDNAPEPPEHLPEVTVISADVSGPLLSTESPAPAQMAQPSAADNQITGSPINENPINDSQSPQNQHTESQQTGSQAAPGQSTEPQPKPARAIASRKKGGRK